MVKLGQIIGFSALPNLTSCPAIGCIDEYNCSIAFAAFIGQEIEKSGILNGYSNIDGIVVLKQAPGRSSMVQTYFALRPVAA